MAKHRYRKRAASSIGSFRRTVATRTDPGSAILVVTEGDNTEPAYFDLIAKRFAAPTVELVPYGAGRGDPRALADEALRLAKERKQKSKAKKLGINRLEAFDSIWIVFDTDVLEPQNRHDGIAYAHSKGIHVAYSEPCFEYWLLLHGKFTTAQMPKCKDVIPFLKEVFGWKNYSREGKKAEEVEALLAPLIEKTKLQLAGRYAQQVRTHHEKAGTPFPANPSTDVDQLIVAIDAAVSPANKFLT
jgi:hypothetical protein